MCICNLLRTIIQCGPSNGCWSTSPPLALWFGHSGMPQDASDLLATHTALSSLLLIPAPFDQYYCLKGINWKLCVCVLLDANVSLWPSTIDFFVLLTDLLNLALIPAGIDEYQSLLHTQCSYHSVDVTLTLHMQTTMKTQSNFQVWRTLAQCAFTTGEHLPQECV